MSIFIQANDKGKKSCATKEAKGDFALFKRSDFREILQKIGGKYVILCPC